MASVSETVEDLRSGLSSRQASGEALCVHAQVHICQYCYSPRVQMPHIGIILICDMSSMLAPAGSE